MEKNIFSDEWYKVANLYVKLNPNVVIIKQVFNNIPYYIIQDPISHQFFKITQKAYNFIAKIDGKRNVEAIWQETLQYNPQNLLTQQEVINLLIHLHQKNLLYFKGRVNATEIAKRVKKRELEQLKQKLLSFFYLHIPLFNPNKILNKLRFVIDIIYSKFGLFIWLIVFFLGVNEVIENFSKIYDNSLQFFGAKNIISIYIAIFILKFFHELSHAFSIKKFGGNVTEMGIMLLILTPLPYVDTSEAYLFTSKTQRIISSLAGILSDLFFASIAAIIWANTNSLDIKAVAFYIMFFGSISSLFFNGNPLLKFDAYYILSDIVEIPNLYEKSKRLIFNFVEKYFFKKEVFDVANNLKEKMILFFYAILSFLYKIFITIAIVVYVSSKVFALGVIFALISLYIWIINPLIKYIQYINHISNYEKKERILITSLLFLIILISLFLIPLPNTIKSQGVILDKDSLNLYTQNEAYLKNIYIKNAKFVNKDKILLEFENKNLSLKLQKLQSKLTQTKYLIQELKNRANINIYSLQKSIKAIYKEINYIKEKIKNLKVYAPKEGVFIANEIEYKKNNLFLRGEKIAQIYPLKRFEFNAIIPQEDAYKIFSNKNYKVEIKLLNDTKKILIPKNVIVLPFQKSKLPSLSLSHLVGGEVVTNKKNKAIESFYLLKAYINTDKKYVGLRGYIKIIFQKQPLYYQIYSKIKQFIQKRYKI